MGKGRTLLSGLVITTRFLNCNVLDRQSHPTRPTITAELHHPAPWETPPTHHKDITSVRHVPSLPEQLQQIPKLPVDIAANGNRTRHWLDIGFFHEDGTDAFAEDFHFWFGEVMTVH
jgi:hypothetical protein